MSINGNNYFPIMKFENLESIQPWFRPWLNGSVPKGTGFVGFCYGWFVSDLRRYQTTRPVETTGFDELVWLSPFLVRIAKNEPLNCLENVYLV